MTKLQEDISESRKNEGSGWFSSGAKSELARTKQSLEVTRQELGIKIEENGSNIFYLFYYKFPKIINHFNDEHCDSQNHCIFKCLN